MPPPWVPWMSSADQSILTLLDRVEIALTPTAIGLALQDEHAGAAPTMNHIARRLRNELSNHGLVHQPHSDEVRGYYAITDLGQRYLHDPDAESEEFVADITDTPDSASKE
jgi:hypothetical protein